VLGGAARPRTLDRFGWPRVTEATLAAYDRAVVDAATGALVTDPLTATSPVEVAT
jgi:hypothetical protein